MPSLADLPPPASPGNAGNSLATPAETAPVAVPAPAEGQLPSPFAEVVQGAIPAVLLPPVGKDAPLDPVQEFAVANFDTLLAAGLDYFESKDLSTVLFNPAKITEKQLQEADKAGKLAEIAPPAQAPAAEAAPADAPTLPSSPAPAPPAPGAAGRLAALGGPNIPASIKPNPVPTQLSKRPIPV